MYVDIVQFRFFCRHIFWPNLTNVTNDSLISISLYSITGRKCCKQQLKCTWSALSSLVKTGLRTLNLIEQRKKFNKLTRKTIPTSPPICRMIAKNDNNILVTCFRRVFSNKCRDLGSCLDANLSMHALLICQNTGAMNNAFIKTIATSASCITLRTPTV